MHSKKACLSKFRLFGTQDLFSNGALFKKNHSFSMEDCKNVNTVQENKATLHIKSHTFLVGHYPLKYLRQ